MKVLAKTKGMEREEWLKWRRMGIGGSDAPVIAGVSPFRSIFELWLDKTGQTGAGEPESECIYFGNVLEPVVRKEFMRRTGLKVRRKMALLQSEEHPFMLADLDGVIYENGKLRVFEAKTASAYKKEAWEEGVPLEYQYQAQHYMAVTGADKTYIAALVGGNCFLYHEVCRDEERIKSIIRMEREFWENCVLAGEEPEADGSGATTDFLNKQYGVSNGKCIELPEEALELCGEYDELSCRLDELKGQKEAVANKIKAYLKENERGTVGNRRIDWKTVTTTTFDKKRLKEEHREIYEEYCGKSSHRRFSVA